MLPCQGNTMHERDTVNLGGSSSTMWDLHACGVHDVIPTETPWHGLATRASVPEALQHSHPATPSQPQNPELHILGRVGPL